MEQNSSCWINDLNDMPKNLSEFDSFIDGPAPETETQSSVSVPNQFPFIHSMPYRIAIIGEAPGNDEMRERKPFVGYSGLVLTKLLSRAKANGVAGIIRDACFIGNVCQRRPPGNVIKELKHDGPQITEGLALLTEDLKKYNPHVCILLGNLALWAANGEDGISDWRGTFFIGKDGPFFGRKCLATFHPASAMRNYGNMPYIAMDIRKALGEAFAPELVVPSRELLTGLSCEEICDRLEKMNDVASVDIEGYVDAMTCVSFADRPDRSLVVPFTKWGGGNYWCLDDEIRIWKAVCKILINPNVKKVFQNGLYDRFVIQWSYGITIRGNRDDTMLKHWELACEMGKGLGEQVSFYCDNEPYYKFERKSGDQKVQWEYCCKDSALTLEISNKLNGWLKAPSLRHYKFNMDMLNPMLYMELHGLRYDSKAAAERLVQVEQSIHALQAKLDGIASADYALDGRSFGFDMNKTRGEILNQARSIMGYKRDPSTPLAKYKDVYDNVIRTIISSPKFTLEERGYLSISCGLSMNIRSDMFKDYLYDHLGLPIQYTKDPKTGKDRVSTDYEALLRLTRESTHSALQLAIDISSLRTRSQMLHISCDADGRIRAGYNVVGSETGRVTCYTSPTGSGYALQTLPDVDTLKPVGHPLHLGMRDLVIADEGWEFGKFDLKGADGWTVGANLNRLGDPTMLDDLKFGIKPAQVLCWMMRHKKIIPPEMNRDEIKALVAEVKKDDWDYFAYKQCIWGFCYLMGSRKASAHVYKLSEGRVFIKEKEMDLAKEWLFRRYRVSLWWNFVGDSLKKQKYPPIMEAPSGHIRKFFGRESDRLGEALAHEPQTNTTYATNSAARRLWMDPENRYYEEKRCKLRVKPMHQVHDELLVQWRISERDWATEKMKEWFNNKILIAGQEIVIPFEGSYGSNWAMDEKSKAGSI